ncbi:tyrosine-type recombinase/integrase [Streptomyces sp. SID5914]|nr:tyrosine-type recombinase/integrase [Streptomyces sp. SID5914]MZG15935.1 tyrosine-type recombinase/integrase [Streptomyces sp. SID5914]
MAALRPEFRRDVIVPARGEMAFGVSGCRVVECSRPARARQLCRLHHRRWSAKGKPPMEKFVADPGGALPSDALSSCTVTGCDYGRASRGICERHRRAWRQAGEPELVPWLTTAAVIAPAGQVCCRLAACQLWTETATSPFCRSHRLAWYRRGRPDVEEFVRLRDSRGEDRFDLRPLIARRQLKLEMQYALQCRRDERRVSTHSAIVSPVIRMLAGSGATSLLERPLEQWEEQFTAAVGTSWARSESIGFIRYAYHRLEDLALGGGWEAEFGRDVWMMRRLGLAERNTRLRFDRIPQPWLKDLAKRYARWRLSTGTTVAAVGLDAMSLARLGTFLASPRVRVDALAGLDRALLERYLAHLALDSRSIRSRNRDIGQLNAFFQAIRRHGWDTSLPASAAFYPEDLGKTPSRLPRALAEHVMAQLEQSANLDRWTTPDARLLTVILMGCGLRVGDACQLAFDCIVRDGQGAPYLRYANRKMKREALVPIDETLEAEIAAQQQRVLAQWPTGSPWLLPAARMNPDGNRPLSPRTYAQQLAAWLKLCEVRDEHGRPVHLTAHQWRHTFATRLINKDVPQEVVRVLLDHTSTQMTAHYARLHDTTVRRHWEAARKVDIRGEEVTLDPDGPLAAASWAKQRLGRATQALPNGYCGLPVQKTCPHANACLTCPMFVTTPEFLPQHREQRQQVLQIISAAEARGQRRVIEMNQQLLGNLDKVITALEDDPDLPEATADAS